MLFNSFVFPVFFVIVFALYICLRHRYQNLLLLLASYVFYGWWDWRFLSLLFTSTIVDYFCALRIKESGSKRESRRYLLISLFVNLGILGIFKYFGFFSDSAARVLSAFGMKADLPTLNLILPVGISFYTFQTLAYTIDVYRGKQEATRDLLSFAVYVAFFPQLVAGPIERSQSLLPQITGERQITPQKISSGLRLVLLGYFRKIFIADGVAPLVDSCFDDPAKFAGLSLAAGAVLFALQIYGDFAGYTDIARGVARMLGIELRLNFMQPYLSRNITEFWRRWHMSLSSWLRDYLYIPLGGNRKGRARTYSNLMITMLLGGLWHGAAWHFVAWGGLHGLYLAAHRAVTRGRKIGISSAPTGTRSLIMWTASAAATFVLVSFAWIFFRAESLGAALEYISMISFGGPSDSIFVQALLFYGSIVFLLDVASWWRDDEVPFSGTAPAVVNGLIYGIMIILMSFIGATDAQPFIYFQF
jgi:D-alanyl-lipoteichoic acid acyltransferase DltB (MBOAT superfamily)